MAERTDEQRHGEAADYLMDRVEAIQRRRHAD